MADELKCQDKNGRALKVGDRVMVPCVVAELGGLGQNVSLDVEGGYRVTIPAKLTISDAEGVLLAAGSRPAGEPWRGPEPSHYDNRGPADNQLASETAAFDPLDPAEPGNA